MSGAFIWFWQRRGQELRQLEVAHQAALKEAARKATIEARAQFGRICQLAQTNPDDLMERAFVSVDGRLSDATGRAEVAQRDVEVKTAEYQEAVRVAKANFDAAMAEIKPRKSIADADLRAARSDDKFLLEAKESVS